LKPNASGFGGKTNDPMNDKYGSLPQVYTNVELMMDGIALGKIIDKRISASSGYPRGNPGRAQ